MVESGYGCKAAPGKTGDGYRCYYPRGRGRVGSGIKSVRGKRCTWRVEMAFAGIDRIVNGHMDIAVRVMKVLL